MSNARPFDPDQVLSYYADWIAWLREKKVELLAQAAKLERSRKKSGVEEVPSPAWASNGDDDLPPIAETSEARPAAKTDSFLEIAFGGQVGVAEGDSLLSSDTPLPQSDDHAMALLRSDKVLFESNALAPVEPSPALTSPESDETLLPSNDIPSAALLQSNKLLPSSDATLPAEPSPESNMVLPQSNAPAPVSISVRPRPAPKAPPVEEGENLA